MYIADLREAVLQNNGMGDKAKKIGNGHCQSR